MSRAVVAIIVSLWVVPMSFWVNQFITDPYMDEIFHIPQAQQYCDGNFRSWDPMITTPPGLYYLSLAIVASLFPGIISMKRASFSDTCSIWGLRSINCILAVICSIIFYEILIHLKPSLDKRMATFSAVVLSLYPLHWFFTFLYYTDVASVAAVMAMYLASLKGKYWSSAWLGAFAVLIRQTNIIWMLFVASVSILDKVGDHEKHESIVTNMKIKKKSCSGSTRSREENIGSSVGSDEHTKTINHTGLKFHLSKLRGRRLGGAFNAINDKMDPDAENRYTCLNFTGFYNEFHRAFFSTWHMKRELMVTHCPFFLISVAFVTFVYWNGGVVLGAKEAHSASPHFTQMLYFGLVSALATAPFHLSVGRTVGLLFKDTTSGFFLLGFALSLGFLLVHFFSMAHPYLLADNRHYTFYLWRKVVASHWLMKYIMVPFYIYSWISILSWLGRRQRPVWIVVYALATAAVLVPAPLIELRYYTVPFFLMVLHSPVEDAGSWAAMGCLYVVVDAFTMYMFLFRPFQWAHEPGTQRFIW